MTFQLTITSYSECGEWGAIGGWDVVRETETKGNIHGKCRDRNLLDVTGECG
jgi:hypothetical protein